jgi:phage pi2 protein 07
VVCIKGCPPSHKRIVWDMMVRYFLLAPLVRPSLIIDGFVLYPLKKFKGWLVNLKSSGFRVTSSE